MINIVLFEPEIPPNTGNIIRLCANTGFQLHLIEPLGFEFDNKKLRRAGLDYHEFTKTKVHKSFNDFLETCDIERCYAITTKGHTGYHQLNYQSGDALVFGPETRGLPPEVLDKINTEKWIRVPMQPDSRSLNLSNTVAIVAYEAWRQMDFSGNQ
jgi:tRNA (cytidine/uridine-2'-O-)-methyltransferase